MKAKKATIIKNGIEFILINPESDISLDILSKLFGNEVIKINSGGFGLFEIEALNGNEKYFQNVESISNLEWGNITL